MSIVHMIHPDVWSNECNTDNVLIKLVNYVKNDQLGKMKFENVKHLPRMY